MNDAQSQFWRERPAEELYDTQSDPDEIYNLIGDQAYTAIHQRMSTALDAHMIAVNDNGFIPEGDALEGYSNSRKPGAYPLQDVMRLAGTAIQRDPSNIPALLPALASGNVVMRYWAALGFCMLERRALDARGTLLHAFASEESPQVKIALAEALCRQDAVDGAVAYLGQTLIEHTDPYVRLMAANALENIGERAMSALPELLKTAAQIKDSPKLDPAKLTPRDIEQLKKRYSPKAQADQHAPLAAGYTVLKLQYQI